jgi:VIT1/CCC1 family predicted Fe2+/Mn2+ transporter
MELTEKDPLRAHLAVEYNLDPDNLNNPWAAAAASAVAFTTGSLIPLLATILAPGAWMPWPIVVATVLALLITGLVSARIGASGKRVAMFRVLIGGMLALAATWFVGSLFDTPVH